MAEHVLPFPESKVPKGGEFGNTILFDGTKRPNPHRGTDFSVPAGTPIKSATSGEVTLNKESAVLGWVVVVKDPKGVYWGYCHLRQPGARVGTKVVAGETVIGLVGNTGSASHGAHLHWTCSPLPEGVFAGKVVDPLAGLKARIAKENASKPAPAPAPVVEEAPADAPAEPEVVAEAPKPTPKKVVKKAE
jgi:murein DD-endopeptidase MepM/ murein hydrolase activator NlpD